MNPVSNEIPVPELHAVIAGHGDFASGLVSAVHQISGKGSALTAVSNAGLSGPAIDAALLRALEVSGASVLFTDLPAGSCTMSARRLQRSRPGLVVVTGVNLATVLEFVFRSPDESPAIAAAAAADKGRATLVVHS